MAELNNDSLDDVSASQWERGDSLDDVSASQWDEINRSALAQKRKGSLLPEGAKERKDIPVYTGFINYFPRAIAAVAKISLIGGLQHGQSAETLHWDRSKSGDELDALMRHILDGDWEIVEKYTYKVSKAGEDIVYPSKLVSL
jgi:hypothetical protein